MFPSVLNDPSQLGFAPGSLRLDRVAVRPGRFVAAIRRLLRRPPAYTIVYRFSCTAERQSPSEIGARRVP